MYDRTERHNDDEEREDAVCTYDDIVVRTSSPIELSVHVTVNFDDTGMISRENWYQHPFNFITGRAR